MPARKHNIYIKCLVFTPLDDKYVYLAYYISYDKYVYLAYYISYKKILLRNVI